jgi:hypothetical protein
MSGPKRVQNLNIPAASDKELRIIYALIQDLDKKIMEQVVAPLTVSTVENSLIYDSIGM